MHGSAVANRAQMHGSAVVNRAQMHSSAVASGIKNSNQDYGTCLLITWLSATGGGAEGAPQNDFCPLKFSKTI